MTSPSGIVPSEVKPNVTDRLYTERRHHRVWLGMDDVRQRLALNLRKLRQAKGLSQEAFADEAGLHRTYISDIERGARNPTITVVDRIAQALNVPIGKMVD